MSKALIVHGHFYQPPRENPWTDAIDTEPSAQPFHDWNERIHFECYRPNAFARIVDTRGRVARIVNNYAHISFNFGPTLLSWLEHEQPLTYRRIVEADRESVRARGGHGNAVAQSFHHTILPLSNERDRRTEVRWGMADFRRRFGREPEALWLPETACSDDVLETLIDERLRFVILSPFQAARVRESGAGKWHDVSGGLINTSHPYKFLHRDGSGRSIAVFFYDGSVSRAIAFDGLLASSHAFVERLAQTAASGPLVNVATDGESYGHHYKFGDRCLAYALEELADAEGLRVTNYGAFLEENPPVWEVEISAGPDGEGTAWSCAHGLGRWSRDCGCHAGAPEGWNQSWRAPLRAALDLLRDDAARKFETHGGDLFRDPWETRDAYGELLADRNASLDSFLRRHQAPRLLSVAETERALALLEIQRGALAMYTSCGWFFNDISGIEAVQVLRLAGRVVDLMDKLDLAPPLEDFLEILSEAKSNLRSKGNGAEIYLRAVEISRAAPARARTRPIASELPAFASNASDDSAGEAAILSQALRSPNASKVIEDLITLTVVNVAAAPTPENHRSALTILELARKLNPHLYAERAQEILYEALSKGLNANEETFDLAVALGLAPDLLDAMLAAPVPDEEAARFAPPAETALG